MTAPKTPDSLIRAFLEEGQTDLPDHVYDAVRGQVDHTRQRATIGRWRGIDMRRFIARGLIAAAAVLAVGVSINLLSSFGVGVGPSSRPSPSHYPRPSTDASASPGPAGKIAFTSNRTGNPEIYVMNADGSGQTNVSHGPGEFIGPDGWSPGGWSPDGSRIAFSSNRDGKGEVYVVNADGSGLTNVSNDPCGAGVLPWSPDGSRIAFSSGPGRGMRSGLYPPPTAGGCIYTIYVVNADGSGRTNLTNGPADFGAWSPDGSRIAFTRGDNGNRDVYVVNADGSGLTNLTNSPGFDDLLAGDRDGPTWSPDSSRVRFTSECRVVGREPDLYEVNADGSGGLTNLGHPGPIFNGGVAGCAGSSLFAFAIAFSDYSPDGSRIAFTSNDNGYKMTDLYVMNADGSGVVTRLTNNPASDGGPDWFPSPNEGPVWSPDGSHIVFTADRDGDGIGEIYVVNADGSGLTNLSNNPGVDGFGAWSPDGSRIFLTSGRVGDGIGGDGNGEIYVVNADGSGLTNLTKNPGNDYGPGWSPAR